MLFRSGEFSYILADLGIGLGVLTAHARDVILGVSILSIVVNPFLFSYALSFRAREEAARAGEGEVRAPKTELQPTSLTGHAVLIGYGRVGQLVGETLVKEGWRIFVIEDAADVAERLRAQGIEIVSGNAADEKVLGAANLAAAKLLFVAIPNAFEAGQIVQQARSANPKLEIAARAHFDAEVEYLKRFGADEVIMGEREIAHAMLDYARQRKAAASA